MLVRWGAALALLCGLGAPAMPALATDVEGKLVLGSYRVLERGPEVYWELQNAVRATKRERIDAARELTVVLLGKRPMPGNKTRPVVLRGGSLLPSTIAVQVGTTLRIRNEDEIAHELHAVGLTGFSAEATSPRHERTVRLSQTGDWPLRDRLVVHVSGHLHVLSNLVATAQPDADGRYRFSGVSPGRYQLKVFHGPNEIANKRVVVGSKGELSVPPIVLKAPKRK
ncbi:MAG: hypothetical protein MJD61_20585 [Proteobacteria bacterium]|nr:hypothetical protein [Pseudomonadota bacterium]